MKPPRTRLADIVRHTGLSRSTVDRVLNDRPGVKSGTKQRVAQALRELGYSPYALSAWHSGATRSVDVILPEGTNPFFAELRSAFDRVMLEMSAAGVDVHVCGMNPYAPQTAVDALLKVRPAATSVITVGIDTPEVTSAINDLVLRGLKVVTIVSDVPGSRRTCYVGQNDFNAGRIAGRLMLNAIGPAKGTVATLIGHMQFRHLLDRRSGFEQMVGLQRPEMTLFTSKAYGTDPIVAQDIVRALVLQHRDLRGIYLCGGGQPKLIEALRSLPVPKPIIIGHEVTAHSRRALLDQTFSFIVANDPNEIGRKAIDAALRDAPLSDPTCSVSIFVAENLPQTAD
jgi:LacI family transcriptional regulator